MTIRRVMPNITSNRLEESREFNLVLFGFEVAMDMDWIVTLAPLSNPTAQISLVRGPPADAAQEAITLTLEVPVVDAVHAAAVARRLPIQPTPASSSWPAAGREPRRCIPRTGIRRAARRTK